MRFISLNDYPFYCCHTVLVVIVICCLSFVVFSSHFSGGPSSRPSFPMSFNPMSFKKSDGDSYQQSFVLHASSLREHQEIENSTADKAPVS